MTTHTIEFWHYITGTPTAISVHIDETVVSLPEHFPEMPHTELSLDETIQEEIRQRWQQGLQANPRMTNNLKPVIHKASTSGFTAALSTYAVSYWMKNCLSEHGIDTQKAVANQFPFFNIGIIAVTADDKILLEQRPENVTAGGMLLNYPCGYLSRGDTSLVQPVVAQSKGELGYAVIDENGLHPSVKSILVIGMQRESDEWTPNVVMLMYMNIPFAEIRPTKETKVITACDVAGLEEFIVQKYSATIKGRVSGLLVPNAAAMLMMAVREIHEEEAYKRLCGRLTSATQTRGYNLCIQEYTPATNPFV